MTIENDNASMDVRHNPLFRFVIDTIRKTQFLPDEALCRQLLHEPTIYNLQQEIALEDKSWLEESVKHWGNKKWGAILAITLSSKLILDVNDSEFGSKILSNSVEFYKSIKMQEMENNVELLLLICIFENSIFFIEKLSNLHYEFLEYLRKHVFQLINVLEEFFHIQGQIDLFSNLFKNDNETKKIPLEHICPSFSYTIYISDFINKLIFFSKSSYEKLNEFLNTDEFGLFQKACGLCQIEILTRDPLSGDFPNYISLSNFVQIRSIRLDFNNENNELRWVNFETESNEFNGAYNKFIELRKIRDSKEKNSVVREDLKRFASMITSFWSQIDKNTLDTNKKLGLFTFIPDGELSFSFLLWILAHGLKEAKGISYFMEWLKGKDGIKLHTKPVLNKETANYSFLFSGDGNLQTFYEVLKDLGLLRQVNETWIETPRFFSLIKWLDDEKSLKFLILFSNNRFNDLFDGIHGRLSSISAIHDFNIYDFIDILINSKILNNIKDQIDRGIDVCSEISENTKVISLGFEYLLRFREIIPRNLVAFPLIPDPLLAYQLNEKSYPGAFVICTLQSVQELSNYIPKFNNQKPQFHKSDYLIDIYLERLRRIHFIANQLVSIGITKIISAGIAAKVQANLIPKWAHAFRTPISVIINEIEKAEGLAISKKLCKHLSHLTWVLSESFNYENDRNRKNKEFEIARQKLASESLVNVENMLKNKNISRLLNVISDCFILFVGRILSTHTTKYTKVRKLLFPSSCEGEDYDLNVYRDLKNQWSQYDFSNQGDDIYNKLNEFILSLTRYNQNVKINIPDIQNIKNFYLPSEQCGIDGRTCIIDTAIKLIIDELIANSLHCFEKKHGFNPPGQDKIWTINLEIERVSDFDGQKKILFMVSNQLNSESSKWLESKYNFDSFDEDAKTGTGMSLIKKISELFCEKQDKNFIQTHYNADNGLFTIQISFKILEISSEVKQ